MKSVRYPLLLGILYGSNGLAQDNKKMNAYNPSGFLQEKNAAPGAETLGSGLRTEIVTIGDEKYVKIQGKDGALYLSYLGDINKEQIEKGSCANLHKAKQLREEVSQDYKQQLSVHIVPKVELYAALIVRTIKDKCTNRAEQFSLPVNAGEVGVEVKDGNKSIKVYNNFNPVSPKSNQLNPGVGMGTKF